MNQNLTKENKVLYVVNYLKNIIEQRILSLIKSNYKNIIRIINKFYEVLEVTFSDSNKKVIAQRYIQKLK